MRTCLIAAAVMAVAAATAAHAETLHFHIAMSGGNEVPTNATKAVGLGSATLDTDTKMLTYDIGYIDLSGPATAAHIHGPADPGVNAPPIVTVMSPRNPLRGQATLTDDQIGELKAGKLYFNVHTNAFPAGEIRGQIMPGS